MTSQAELNPPHPPTALRVPNKGSLQISVHANYGMLTIHVFRGRQIASKKNPLCNSFVRLSLLPDVGHRAWCRTEVVKLNPHPNYDEKFSFELFPEDTCRRLYISVWHIDDEQSDEEFMGCMSFGLKHIVNHAKDVDGWYYLLNEEMGQRKHLRAPTVDDSSSSSLDTNTTQVVPAGTEAHGDTSHTQPPQADNPANTSSMFGLTSSVQAHSTSMLAHTSVIEDTTSLPHHVRFNLNSSLQVEPSRTMLPPSTSFIGVKKYSKRIPITGNMSMREEPTHNLNSSLQVETSRTMRPPSTSFIGSKKSHKRALMTGNMSLREDPNPTHIGLPSSMVHHLNSSLQVEQSRSMLPPRASFIGAKKSDRRALRTGNKSLREESSRTFMGPPLAVCQEDFRSSGPHNRAPVMRTSSCASSIEEDGMETYLESQRLTHNTGRRGLRERDLNVLNASSVSNVHYGGEYEDRMEDEDWGRGQTGRDVMNDNNDHDGICVDAIKIVVQRNSGGGFGFSISGSRPSRVCHVIPGSTAARAGLKLNDQIMRINDFPVFSSSTQDIVDLVRYFSKSKLRLEIQRPYNAMDMFNVSTMNRSNVSMRNIAQISKLKRQKLKHFAKSLLGKHRGSKSKENVESIMSKSGFI